MIDFSRNHFELFGLPLRYPIDGRVLEQTYRALQGAVHPDRYAGATDTEKRLALQASARVNEAYRTLRDPVARAEYLLSLRGVNAASEADTRLAVPFLVRQLERREQAEEASDEHDMPRLAALAGHVREDAAEVATEVERALDADDDERARARVRELRFLVKLAEDIEALGAAEIDE
jgi:molecular chaperone HscB